jgi:hypothetical protein
MRTIALGRKNYLFVGSEAGGKAAAIAYTLIETAKLKAVDPHAWLTDTLARVQDYKSPRSTTCCHGAGTYSAQTGRFREKCATARGFTVALNLNPQRGDSCLLQLHSCSQLGRSDAEMVTGARSFVGGTISRQFPMPKGDAHFPFRYASSP